MDPLISVIVPVYNVEQYLEVCIKSIVTQTYKRIEILIIDDGSTDSSGVMCDEWSKKDDRIKVIHTENKGLSAARNYGLNIANGDYIIFVDSDDYVEKNFFSNLFRVLLEHQADIAIAPMCHVKEETNLCIDFHEKEIIQEYDSRAAIIESFYQKKFSCNAPSKIFKKDLFLSIRFPEGRVTEDLAIAYKLFESSSKIVATNKWGYFYRQRNKSILHSFNKKRLDALEWLDEMARHFGANDVELIKALHCRMINVAVHLALDIPQKNEYKKENSLVWSYIKKYRTETLFNNSARLQDRGSALLSFLGQRALKHVWNSNFAIKRKEY